MTILKLAWAVFSIAFSVIGGMVGSTLGNLYSGWDAMKPFLKDDPKKQAVCVAVFITMGVLGGAAFGAWTSRRTVAFARRLDEISPAEKIAAVIGVIIGLVFAYLTTFPFQPPLIQPGWIGLVLRFLACIVCAYLGVSLTMSIKDQFTQTFPRFTLGEPSAGKDSQPAHKSKLLDTNVIIDGRMADVCKTGFVEGPIYVPSFVLQELHTIADSADSLRRARGRRGLDVLNTIRKELTMLVRVYDKYDPEIDRLDTVDAKLIRLARELDASIITNDFNLNKVAELQGVTVLNLNQLANALKPVVLPGEDMTVNIVKEGKEPEQGVGYLEDGTMVVVEDGKKYINQSVLVVISSVYQTVAGKMIFADIRTAHVGSGDDLFGDEDRGDGAPGGGRPRRKSGHFQR